ncbi:Imm30 family immunity protein [Clostridium kluyveri]|uniref:Immunity protein 30 domain-containing protein n=1 Tax=Clostridium kluyveri TaxID=1534 RepID=A0A1L5F8J7_CLOKL|nr:Imm30 family immunity protein [Clostridium kluyveri]APM39140.1 hypothetical protein BS101_10475 [Clostridium kluyveri]
MDINIEAKKLKDNRLLKTEEEIRNFEQAVENIISMKDVNNIKYLCLGFDDSTEHDEVMFGLIHAIESYDKMFGAEEALAKLAEAIPDMYPHAKEWVKVLHKRILNDAPSRKIYVKVISNSDSSIKKTVIDLFSDIMEKNPSKFEMAVNEFLAGLN